MVRSASSQRPQRQQDHYGAHDLSGQYGKHYVFNNQSGGASVTLNKGYNGADPVFDLNAYTVTNYDLTPINSVTLIQ